MMRREVRVAMAMVVCGLLVLMAGCGDGGGGAVPRYVEGLYLPYVVGAAWTYEERLPLGGTAQLTWTVVGTRTIADTECLDVRVDEDGIPLMHAYGTVDDWGGGRLYATGDPTGTAVQRVTPPAQFFPTNPPRDFVTRASFFGLEGYYEAKVVSTAESVTVPAGVFDNAVRVQMTCEGSSPTTATSATYWLVPNVGPVKVELRYAGVGVERLRLVSYELPYQEAGGGRRGVRGEE